MGYIMQNILKIGPQEHGKDTGNNGLKFKLGKKGHDMPH